jgi:hypothetical protein
VNKSSWLQIALALVLAGSAQAEPIYLRNRLFKGPQQGHGRALLIGMKAFAEVMDLQVTDQEGTIFLHPKGVTGTDFGVRDPGAVYVVGRKVESQAQADGTLLISLWQAAESAGFRVIPNASLGTVDVAKAPVPKIDLPMEVGASDAVTTPDTDPGNEAESVEKPGKKAVKRGTIPGKGDVGLKALTPLPPRYINRGGAAVDCSQNLTPGRYNLVVFGADW